MAKRFLPFVTNKTSLEVIHKKLQEGSQGVSSHLILGLLIVIEAKGVDYVKKAIVTVQGGYWNKVFENFLNTEEVEVRQNFTNALVALEHLLQSKGEGYQVKDDIFVTYAKYLNSEETIPTILSNVDEQLVSNSIPQGMFSDYGELYDIASISQLYAYIYYQKSLPESDSPAVKLHYTESSDETY